MLPPSFFDELRAFEKRARVTDEQALASIGRAEKLQQNKPTAGQLGRYALVGGVLQPAIGAVGDVIQHGRAYRPEPRALAASAVKGALGAAAIPIARHYLDQRAELGTLKKYVAEREPHVPLEASDTTPMPKGV